jgi:group I intron endonuclease
MYGIVGKVGIVGIYRLTAPDNSIYIGQTVNFARRKNDHSKYTKYRSAPLSNSLLKFGYKNHKMELIHELPKDISQHYLDQYEIFYIKQYKDVGFNLLNVQLGGKKGTHSDETRKRMSEIRKGKKLSPETVEKGRLSRIGTKRSLDTKLKLREQKLGSKNPMFGKPVSLETRQKISEAHLGKKGISPTEITRQKLREVNNKIVYQYSKDGVFIREWESVKVAQESLGCFSISPVALGKRKYKTSGGFIWKYIKN